MLNLQNSLSLLLNGMRMSSGENGQNQQQKGTSDGIAPGHPLGASNLLGNGPYRTPLPAEVMSQNAKTQGNQNMQTVFIGDLPKEISSVELYEYLKEVAGECDLVLKRPQMKFFYYAFARFADICDAKKLLEDVKFPQVHG